VSRHAFGKRRGRQTISGNSRQCGCSPVTETQRTWLCADAHVSRLFDDKFLMSAAMSHINELGAQFDKLHNTAKPPAFVMPLVARPTKTALE